MKYIKFFHIKISPLSMQQIIDKVDRNIREEGDNMLVTSVNSAMTIISKKNKLISDAINFSNIINIDGMSIYFALRILGFKVPERVAGPDLFYNLIKLSSDKGYRVYFLGSKPEAIQAMISNFNSEFPKLKIAGYQHGYYKEDEMDMIFKNIENSKADMLFLGITSPKRELFINEYFSRSHVKIWKGVGGAFDIFANLTKRAPKWIQNIGMEWFYRLYQEPKRMWKRYLITNTVFVGLILMEIFRKVFNLRRKIYWM
jgi:N-acetylglucosaminyldiphosphoundecaprenol N-acetyl-beta-D-mannosaminyltransferase